MGAGLASARPGHTSKIVGDDQRMSRMSRGDIVLRNLLTVRSFIWAESDVSVDAENLHVSMDVNM